MASSPSATPASSSHSWNHDVFLSFRGEDTRKTFVDHLYTAHVQHGLYTYKDDETLPRGELIGPSLKKAIQESRITIIVFSENYADSSWCLDELAYIMKCMEERGQTVIPVFYHVNPSDIRKQKGKFGEAFFKYESVNKNKVESWRKALSLAGDLSGWVLEDFANGVPNLRIIKLESLQSLIKTPDCGGLLNLEKFKIFKCDDLEEIHPSVGGLERLVSLQVCICRNLKMFPHLTRSQELKTLQLSNCNQIYKVSDIEQEKKTSHFLKCWMCSCRNFHDIEEPCLPHNNIFNLIGLQAFHRTIRKLILRKCNLGDGENMDSVVCRLHNLEKLDLSWNDFSLLNLGLLQHSRLKWLDVSDCDSLVELSRLPSSLAVLRATSCSSLETVGDISNCKWLWEVSLTFCDRLGPGGGEILLSMLQGNAVEHQFISFTRYSIDNIPKGLVHRLVMVQPFRLKL